ncbi:DHHW family protein [Alkalihalobacillus sp. 1P02AB]|uniref:DHHW family protein n=1 Tax=Alkalihalobacillus sp. 1P02AB TaxID=3132260 RepID=UPI0039A6B35A
MERVRIALFVLFISGLLLWNLFSESRHFSELENRYLAQKPSFSYTRLVDGQFTSEIETYVTDQFIWKDLWMITQANVEYWTNKKESKGIYFGANQYLLEAYAHSSEQFQKNLEYLSYFAQKAEGIQSYVFLAPTSIEMYPELLPSFVINDSQVTAQRDVEAYLEGEMNVINGFEVLAKHKDESIYFRTDHHWTMRGAFYAYQKIAEEMNLTPHDIHDYKIEEVSSQFYGTYDTKAPLGWIQADKIEIFQLIDGPRYQIHYPDSGLIEHSFYEWDYLKKRDQYGLFLNGQHRYVKIKSDVNNGRKLLLIKDSYAHVIAPLLASHFEEIHMVDLRYYRDNMYEVVKEQNITDVLFLYNHANFSIDTNLLWLKQ